MIGAQLIKIETELVLNANYNPRKHEKEPNGQNYRCNTLLAELNCIIRTISYSLAYQRSVSTLPSHITVFNRFIYLTILHKNNKILNICQY